MQAYIMHDSMHVSREGMNQINMLNACLSAALTTMHSICEEIEIQNIFAFFFAQEILN